MAKIPSVPNYIYTEETDFRSPVSESTLMKVGGTANFILDNYVVYPGMVSDFAGPEANVPSAYIVCDGRLVSKTTYANLYAAIGDYWGAGTLTHFNVPDLRGAFTRMTDQTSAGIKGRDPDMLTRTPQGLGTAAGPGSYQADCIQTHYHEVPVPGGGGAANRAADAGNGGSVGTLTTSPERTARSSSETRAKNLYVLKIIKW